MIGDLPVRKIPTRKLLGAMIAGALFLPNPAFTLGLGEIEVNSALNQQLRADIELLSTTPEDAKSIIVKLASRNEFSRAGIDRPYALNDLRFKSEMVDGVPHIIVTSTSPIREPFLNFLIEVDWPNGHLLREYTVLLDPPVFMTQSANTTSTQMNDSSGMADDSDFRPGSSRSPNNIVPVAAVASMSPESSSGQSSFASTRAPATSNFVPAPVMQEQTTINQPAGSYRIKSGDTAWSLADAMRPDQSISVEQMMIAMLRANPESFINENVNGLKRGYILRASDYDQIASVSQSDARALVREQAALWKQYQRSQAGGQPVSAMKSAKGAAASGSSDVGVAADDAYLEIVSAGSGSSTSSVKDPTQMSAKELRAELALARERIETERVEKEVLQGRVESLEQHVDKMKGMLSIEDNALSEVQSLNRSPDGESPVVEDDATTDMAATEDLQKTLEESEAPESEVMGAEGEEVAAAEGTQETAELTDEVGSESAEENAGDIPELADTATDNFDATPTPIESREPTDLLSKLLNNPVILAAAAAGLLLVLAVIGLIVKRRKAAAEEAAVVTNGFDGLDSFADEIADETASAKAEVANDSVAGDSEDAAEEHFDSDATMILDSEDTGHSAAAESADVEDEPRDDVIAEADVYLAYGIYQQAEDLLTQAIADNPERDDYRVKLAETHYASKNTDAFVEVAREIHNRAKNENSPAWKKIMVMGQDMCADNPMFQGSMVGGLDVGSLVPGAPEMDFDLGLDSDEGATNLAPDLDLSLGDEPLELPEMDSAPASDTQDHDSTVMLDKESDGAAAEPIDELEFDLSDTGAVDVATATEDEFSLDIDASELDIDITEAVEASTDDEVEESIDLTEMDDIDLDFGLDDVEAVAEDTEDQVMAEVLLTEDEEISIDLSDEIGSLDTDLDDRIAAEEVSPQHAAPVETSTDEMSLDADGDFDLSSLDDVDEISTKLDLARAYLDMGDHEGTRDILAEVLAEGSDEQIQEAKELMEKLD